MRIRDLAFELERITKRYFVGAPVVWGNTRGTRPSKPLVVISLTPGSTSTHSIRATNDGDVISLYPSRATYTIDLFTNGEALDIGRKTKPMINTAYEDIQQFVFYMDSEYVSQWAFENNVNFMILSHPTDLTEAFANIEFEYRARVEYSVDFLQDGRGMYNMRDGKNEWRDNPSGGGNEEMASEEIGYFTRTEVTDMDTNRKEIIPDEQHDD